MRGHKISFVVYPTDGGPPEEVGSWPMAFLPTMGHVVTLTNERGCSTWVVQQVVHHVGTDEGEPDVGIPVADFHQVDIVVAPAEELGVRAPRGPDPSG